MKKVIYIAGLGHSGSTILDMALGCHKKIVGLGEIYAVFNKENTSALFEKSTCSCGKKGKDCDFWKSLKEFSGSDKSTEDKYRKLINIFTKKYGDEMILLDSSKNSYPYLQFLNKEYDLRIIYLTRDIRSWIYSRFTRTKIPMFFLALRWFLENKKLLYVLRKYGVKMMTVGYEELSLYPEFILKKISRFINIDFNDIMLHPNNTNSHIINGNISRVDKEKKTGFFYDFRWMTSGRLARITSIIAIFNKMNKRLVYSNISETTKGEFHIFGKQKKEKLLKEHNE
ncbi:MAG: sulfotransferase domain-containing protein [Chlorobi bacterium]|nr:sulfotransferase domain-containing protein [Chlorobiota bacterium]